MLPLGLLEVSEEVREHAELVRKQAKKSFEVKKSPDPKKLSLVFQKLGLCTAADYRDEIGKLREEIAVQAGAGAAPSVI